MSDLLAMDGEKVLGLLKHYDLTPGTSREEVSWLFSLVKGECQADCSSLVRISTSSCDTATSDIRYVDRLSIPMLDTH